MFVEIPTGYEFRNLRAGAYVVRASREGYETRDLQLSLAGDTELNIELRSVRLPPQVGAFEAIVRDSRSGEKLEGVRVEGLSGVGAGRVTTTNAAGLFRFELPPGNTRFRWSKEGYVNREQDVHVQAGGTTTISMFLDKFVPPPPRPPGPPYAVTGTVTDSRGNPVSGAEVWIYGQQSPIDHRYAVGRTDSSGRYNLTSPERRPTGIKVTKDGYVTIDVQDQGARPSSTWTVNIIIPRIERYVLLSPTSLKVGEHARIESQITLDDGSRSSGVLAASSSNSSVAGLSPGWFAVGVAPGTATITAAYYGVSATLQVRVVP